ncbi:winged helix DNA-binding protein [Halogeometricum borinquense]|uniref:Winged helix DNA-binding protein n=1 Tax=Halogeometricum borinquense TaxID=60847 RepID=A0A6C0UH44_9EURY|nr:winged helix DNA-binding protein [Halogeometricum borinquense]QIB73893.1 winged helix DNA-binding protein [Halogeometricum borinquense]
MPEKVLTVRVESNNEFFDRALEAAANAGASEMTNNQYGVSLPDEAALARVLSERSLELIRTPAREEPSSLRELARLADRDLKNVSNVINNLAELGLVKIEQDGRSNRPVVWYNEIHVEYDLI